MTDKLGRKMWYEVDLKRKCNLCGLFNLFKRSGKMECEPVGEIINPDVPYCSFFINKNAPGEIKTRKYLSHIK